MLYHSGLFKEKYPNIFHEMNKQAVIKEIPNTKDIWIRDFMPIKNTTNEWVLFRYFPKYLRNAKFSSFITDNRRICGELNIEYTYSKIILDGGSVVYKNNLYFVSERILLDNPSINKTHIIKTLEDILKTDKIILLPEAPNDFTGHLDGVLSILDNKTILLNDYKVEYSDSIYKILKAHHFNIELIPYNPYSNKTYQSAKGIYINYIEKNNLLLVPIFNQVEDDLAIKKLSELFPQKCIIPILCNDLAKEGGLLHCISWDDD